MRRLRQRGKNIRLPTARVSSRQEAGLLRGELLLGENSLLLEGRELLQLRHYIGRGRRLHGRCLLSGELLGLGLLRLR
jgi:hypothetical protein